MNAALEASSGSQKDAFKEDFNKAALKLKRREAQLEEFLKKTHRTRLREREQAPGFNHSVSSRAVWAKRKQNP